MKSVQDYFIGIFVVISTAILYLFVINMLLFPFKEHSMVCTIIKYRAAIMIENKLGIKEQQNYVLSF